jgi:signal peptidase II
MNKQKLLPFGLSALIIFLDQLVKVIIVKNWPQNSPPFFTLGGDFLWLIHVRNKAVAFSLGSNLPETLRPLLFIILPIVVLGFLIWYYFKSDEFTLLQRWAVAGIIGGGAGNLIDRIARTDGVVDFISVNFYGFLGFSRWPTFNIADSSVVICGAILLISILSGSPASKKKAGHE